MITIMRDKLDLIDRARFYKARTFCDLGGTGQSEGAYSAYACIDYRKGYLVDQRITKSMRAKKPRNLELINKQLSDAVVDVGQVDVVFLFYVLLHQPDWRQLIETYAGQTVMFAVFNPQWINGTESVRLMDLESYALHVPYNVSLKFSFDRNSVVPWQWGITNRDLIDVMESVGFRLHFAENCGRFRRTHGVENYSFLFRKI